MIHSAQHLKKGMYKKACQDHYRKKKYTYLRLQKLLSGCNIIGELRLLQLLCESSQGGTDLLGVGAELLHCLQPEGCGGFREGRDNKRTCHHTPIRPQTKASLPSSNGRKSDILYFVKSEETLWREHRHEH